MSHDITETENLMIRRYVMPGIESNMYLMIEGSTALIVDPNVDQEALSLMEESGVREVTVLLTHEHCDHISGVNWLREHFVVEVWASEAAGRSLGDSSKNLAKFWPILLMDMPEERMEAAMKVIDQEYSCHADRFFTKSEHIAWNEHKICMQAAPGHSPGGALNFMDDDILFSGDNLVNGAGVICRLPGGSWKTYCEKTRSVIEALPDDMWIMPGHGESARLGELRKYLDKFGRNN